MYLQNFTVFHILFEKIFFGVCNCLIVDIPFTVDLKISKVNINRKSTVFIPIVKASQTEFQFAASNASDFFKSMDPL